LKTLCIFSKDLLPSASGGSAGYYKVKNETVAGKSVNGIKKEI
jgi:hypothetical protein